MPSPRVMAMGFTLPCADQEKMECRRVRVTISSAVMVAGVSIVVVMGPMVSKNGALACGGSFLLHRSSRRYSAREALLRRKRRRSQQPERVEELRQERFRYVHAVDAVTAHGLVRTDERSEQAVPQREHPRVVAVVFGRVGRVVDGV